MQKVSVLIIVLSILCLNSPAQLSKLANKITNKVIPLSNAEITDGLKEALKIGTDSATARLSAVDGYLKDATVKISLPPEAKPIVDNIALIPGGSDLLAEIVVRINRVAENAAKDAAPIFTHAIQEMDLVNAMQILKGSENAATMYFEQKTSQQLSDLYRPKIQESLSKNLVAGISTQQSWSDITKTWNQIADTPIGKMTGMKSVVINLEDYILQQALKGLFLKIAAREKSIRMDANARGSDLLKRVFNSQNSKLLN